MFATVASESADALARLRSSADVAGLGLAGAVERFASRVADLQALAATRPNLAPPGAVGGTNQAPPAPVPPMRPAPTPPPIGTRTPSIISPSLTALSPATVTTPTVRGAPGAAGGAGGFPVPLPVRIVAMEARASAQMALLALPGQVGAAARQQAQNATPIKDTLDRGGAMASGAFSQAKDSLMSLASVADPFVAWPTYRASVEGLSITVGQMFTPALMEVSGYIQQATAFLDGLDAGTKANIGRWGTFAVAGLAAAAVLAKLGSLFITVANQARAASAMMMATPVGAIVGITATVAGLALAWNSVKQNAQGAAGAMGGMTFSNPFQAAATTPPSRAELGELSPAARASYEAAIRSKSPTDLNAARVAIGKELDASKAAFETAAAAAKGIPGFDDRPATDKIAARTVELGTQARDLLELVKANPGILRGIVPPGVTLTPMQQEAIAVNRRVYGPDPRTISRVAGETADIELRKTIAEVLKPLPDSVKTAYAKMFSAPFNAFDFKPGESAFADRRRNNPASIPVPRVVDAIDPAAARRAEEAKIRFDAIQKVANFTQAQSNAGPMQALGNMPAPSITNMLDLADKLQISALQGSDLESANRAKQLQALEGLGTKMDDLIRAVREQRATPFYRH